MTSTAELVASLLGAVAFTLAGLLVELQSALDFAAGEVSTGAWFGILGLLFLYAGVYLLGYERVLSQYVAATE